MGVHRISIPYIFSGEKKKKTVLKSKEREDMNKENENPLSTKHVIMSKY